MATGSTAASLINQLVVRGLLIVALTVAGVAVVYWLRARLAFLHSTRVRRLIMQGIVLTLEGFGAVVLSLVDFGHMSSSGISDAQNVALWWLGLIVTLITVAQAHVLVQGNDAELQRQQMLAERDDARNERNFFYLVSQTFMGVVSDKRERLSTATTFDGLAERLAPRVQIVALIQATWRIFNSLINGASGAPQYRVRVALFRVHVDRSALQVVHSWNGTTPHCTASSATLAPHMRLALGEDGSLAVAAARRGRCILVPDAMAAHANPEHPFKFFEEGEPRKLKSIAALPIKLEGDSPPFDVLVIDTERLGYFDAGQLRRETELETVTEQLAHRLLLELQLEKLTSEPER